MVLGTLLTAVWAGAASNLTNDFDLYFSDATLRVDFVQFGDGTQEFVGLDRLIRQGVWAGPTRHLVDRFGYGRYAVKLVHLSTGAILFERGFDSYFGEYRTTEAARNGLARAYHNTMLVPFPLQPVRLLIERRAAGEEPEVLWSSIVDPESVEIATEPPTPGATVVQAHASSSPHRTLDIAVIGEGYRADEAALFRDDLARFASLMLSQRPYADFEDRIAIRGVHLPSAESGADEPTHGRYRSTAVGMTFNSLGSERYMLTEQNRSLRDIAAHVPYDALVIMVNHTRYGGGGIYNSYCSFTAHNEWSGYLLLHEFGHSFAGLADEYYSSDVAYSDFYPPGTEPVEANITANVDRESLKWADLVAADTPLPTPWSKERFDSVGAEFQEKRQRINAELAEAVRNGAPADEIAALEQQQQELAEETAGWTEAFLDDLEHADAVGAFEGAGYASEGLYRPMADCLMFRRGIQPLCRVCERAVVEVIRSSID
jgi:hypothetical protein